MYAARRPGVVYPSAVGYRFVTMVVVSPRKSKDEVVGAWYPEKAREIDSWIKNKCPERLFGGHAAVEGAPRPTTQPRPAARIARLLRPDAMSCWRLLLSA